MALAGVVLLGVGAAAMLAWTSRPVTRSDPALEPSVGGQYVFAPPTRHADPTTSTTTTSTTGTATTGTVHRGTDPSLDGSVVGPDQATPVSETSSGSEDSPMNGMVVTDVAATGATETWQRLDVSSGLPLGILEDVVVVQGGAYLAVGTDGAKPLAVLSDDGEHWTRMTVRDPQSHEVTGLFRAATAVGGGVGVVGSGAGRAKAWLTDDRRTWNALAVEGSSEDDVVLSAIASDARTVIAVGFDRAGSGFWRRDAGMFRRVELDETDPLAEGDQIVRDVVWLDDRYLAVGTSGGVPARWTSPDGRSWRSEPLDTLESGAVPVSISRQGGVIVGYTTEGGAAWVPDQAGRQWSRVTMPRGADAPQTLDVVAGATGSARATGREGPAARCRLQTPGSTGSTGSTGSSDWQLCAPPGGDGVAAVRGLLSDGPRWVAVGAVPAVDGWQAAIWVLSGQQGASKGRSGG